MHKPVIAVVIPAGDAGMGGARGDACRRVHARRVFTIQGPTPGLFVFAKLIVLGTISLLGYWWIGEFRRGEIAVVRSLLFRKVEAFRVT